MIKDTIRDLVSDLNRLDRNSDTILLIDWDTRTAMLSQKIGDNVISSAFWILLNNQRDKGRTTCIITSRKLEVLKAALIKFLNNQETFQLIPKSFGFEVLQYATIVYKGSLTDLWVLDSKFSFKTPKLLKWFLKIRSYDYRKLLKSVESTHFGTTSASSN